MSANNFNVGLGDYPFPSQRVSDKEKDKAKWYAACCDWVIAQGMNIRNQEELESKYRMLHGNIDQKHYEKIINPYNAVKEDHKRFPAVMRNYDLLKGIIRRYVGEYIKHPHNFIVTACNPEIMLNKNAKLKKELGVIIEAKISEIIANQYTEFINQGGDPSKFKPSDDFDVESFVKNFNEKYVDDISIQGQQLLNVIKKITDDTIIYARAYFDFVSFGEMYTYSEVDSSGNLIKRCVPVRDAFPVPNNEMFVEDFDMFAERRMLTYQQIMDEFDEYLDKDQRKFLDEFYSKQNSQPTILTYNVYKEYFDDVCDKFTNEERKIFSDDNIMARDITSDLYEVWHAVWRGEVRRSIVTFVNEIGLVDKRVESGEYKLNKELGDISIEYIYEPQVYESVRIGTRNAGIYPYKARAINYNRNGKLPYNGLCELFPGFGRFSIIETVAPYQVFYNIVSYHREMALAKHKLGILMIAKSLLGTDHQATIHKLLASGMLLIDDDNDAAMLKSQQVRMLDTSTNDYIMQLGNLLDDINNKANMQVDMTPQRYGEIANYAGKGTTNQAIVQGSMGSVIIEYLADCVRERDYRRDLDYSKFAWIDGLDTSYRDNNKELKYISLDVDKHVNADYLIFVENSANEVDKFEQIKQYAFSASQNGNYDLAIAILSADNIAGVKEVMGKLTQINQQNQMQSQQMEQQLKQLESESKLAEIAAEGEQDRETLMLKGEIDKQIEYIKAQANIASFGGAGERDASAAASDINAGFDAIEDRKLNLEERKLQSDNINREKDRDVKLKELDSKERIATTNRNKHDK